MVIPTIPPPKLARYSGLKRNLAHCHHLELLECQVNRRHHLDYDYSHYRHHFQHFSFFYHHHLVYSVHSTTTIVSNLKYHLD